MSQKKKNNSSSRIMRRRMINMDDQFITIKLEEEMKLREDVVKLMVWLIESGCPVNGKLKCRRSCSRSSSMMMMMMVFMMVVIMMNMMMMMLCL
jgi:hypothetical protein